MTRPPSEADVYIEFIQVGAYLKVVAVDSVTHDEVSLVADPKTPQRQLEQLAVRKLRHFQEKKKNPPDSGDRGLLV